jgi:DNA-binding IclR family transcriptional regulator
MTASRASEPAVAQSAYLQSVRRGIGVLDALARSPAALSAREVADSVGLDRTITHRILRTLQVEEMVVRHKGGYAPGPRMLQLGNNFLRRHPLRLASLPYQIDLLYRGYPDQPWALSVLMPVQRHMTVITQIWSPTAPLDSLLGVPEYEIDQTSSGRCILAYLPAEQVVDLIGKERAKSLEPRFAEIRDAGGIEFGPERGANGPSGLLALAALIRSSNGTPVAGLTMSGVGLEDHAQRDSKLAVRLLRTAEHIGNHLD